MAASVPFPAMARGTLVVVAADGASGDGRCLGTNFLFTHCVWIVVLARRVGIARGALGWLVGAHVLPAAEFESRLRADAGHVAASTRDVRVVAGCVPYG